jgi:hypothetical protein
VVNNTGQIEKMMFALTAKNKSALSGKYNYELLAK